MEARRLRRALNLQCAYYVASPEPKAAQTVEELAADSSVVVDTGFGEVRRPYVESDYRSIARSYVQGKCPEGSGGRASRSSTASMRQLHAMRPRRQRRESDL